MGFLQTPVQPCPVVVAESQPGEIQGDVLLVQEPQHQTFPMEGGQGGNPHVHLPVLPGFLEPSVLGQPFFSDVHAGKDLKPGNQRVLEIFRHGPELLEHAVQPAADHHPVRFRFQMDVTGPLFQSLFHHFPGQEHRRGHRTAPYPSFQRILPPEWSDVPFCPAGMPKHSIDSFLTVHSYPFFSL